MGFIKKIKQDEMWMEYLREAYSFYARDGACRRGARCPFAHVPSAATRPSPEEVAAAIAAAEADRKAAVANAGGAPPRPDRGLGAGEGGAALQSRFFPEAKAARAARDADQR